MPGFPSNGAGTRTNRGKARRYMKTLRMIRWGGEIGVHQPLTAWRWTAFRVFCSHEDSVNVFEDADY